MAYIPPTHIHYLRFLIFSKRHSTIDWYTGSKKKRYNNQNTRKIFLTFCIVIYLLQYLLQYLFFTIKAAKNKDLNKDYLKLLLIIMVDKSLINKN